MQSGANFQLMYSRFQETCVQALFEQHGNSFDSLYFAAGHSNGPGDINKLFIPHGLLIGAGLLALTQAMVLILRGPTGAGSEAGFTRSEGFVRRALAASFGLYVAAATFVAALSGLWVQMSPAKLLGWVLFAAISCIAAEFIVGFSAMYAGFFPAFATALSFLLLGMIMGFPPAATALPVSRIPRQVCRGCVQMGPQPRAARLHCGSTSGNSHSVGP
jgi:hypothetical protein